MYTTLFKLLSETILAKIKPTVVLNVMNLHPYKIKMLFWREKSLIFF